MKLNTGLFQSLCLTVIHRLMLPWRSVKTEQPLSFVCLSYDEIDEYLLLVIEDSQ